MTVYAPSSNVIVVPRMDRSALAGVQVAGGLVGQDQSWSDDQRARDAHELLLPAGELLGEEVALGDHPEAVQHSRIPAFQSYSCLSATIGSTFAARRAEIEAARRATPVNTISVTPNTAGS
jgi:hypothetical protein